MGHISESLTIHPAECMCLFKAPNVPGFGKLGERLQAETLGQAWTSTSIVLRPHTCLVHQEGHVVL